jgi:Ni,Fe-hydrogenase III small subunit
MWTVITQIARSGWRSEAAPQTDDSLCLAPGRIQTEILRTLGRALMIRQVDAGSCNGCELEIQALSNPCYNLEGLGIKFVASPRHADMLLVTGPVTKHMASALRRTYEAMPEPRLVVAAGDCGCNAGIFDARYACGCGVADILPVDVAITGCPPPPLELLRAILTAVQHGAAKK